MGQSLLVTYLHLPDKGDPDYAAGHAAVDQLTLDRVDATWNLGQAVSADLETSEPAAGTPDDWPNEQDFLVALKRRLHRRIDELRLAYADRETSRDWVVLPMFGHRLLLTGGFSWGDSPTELFDIIEELSDCPAVLHAMRCDLDLTV
jgi:hypothetical protein